MSRAYLILENGKVFEGNFIGKPGKTVGEVVFNTGMVGYLETLTDKNNFGQIVVQTFPMIGNYGIIGEDFQSEKPTVSGYVAREVCDTPSNFRCQGTLTSYLDDNDVVGICGIDTRALTKVLREEGTMNGMICEKCVVNDEILSEIKAYKIENPAKKVSSQNNTYSTPLSKLKLALYDLGANKNIIEAFLHLDCDVLTFNEETDAEEILKAMPDGVIISDGPGNPVENNFAIEQVKKLFEKKIPLFGIGLGHQIMALALGAETYKLPYGHRGASGPCKKLDDGVLSIITQNHGYCVKRETLPKEITVSYENANDKSIEGLVYCGYPAFSTQFRPDFSTSPTGEKSLYSKFTELCKEVNYNAVK